MHLHVHTIKSQRSKTIKFINFTSLVARSLDSLKKKGLIDEKNRKYLLGSKHKLGRFYLLIKIHKRLSDVLDGWLYLIVVRQKKVFRSF